MAVLLAKWGSTCNSPTCGEPIEEGDQIGFYDDQVMHVGCAEACNQGAAESEFQDLDDDLEDLATAPRPVPHCDVCWVPLPCFCDPDAGDN